MVVNGTSLGEPTDFACSAPVFDRIMHGGSDGILSPGTLAREVLGEIAWGTLHAYMHRRFGPPNLPSDPYDLVAQWYLTTPMDGLYLTVRVRPSDVNSLFGFLATNDVYEAIAEAQARTHRLQRERYESWCRETHGRLPGYWSVHQAETPPSADERETLLKEASDWFAAFRQQDVETDAEDVHDMAAAALRRALRDLTRTVPVRDQDFSVLGEVEAFEGAETSPAAGRLAPPYAYTDAAWTINGVIARLGGGETGMAALLKMVGAKAD